jgi:hypothetical protein
MIKKIISLKLLLCFIIGYSQATLTYVGNSALVTIQSNTLVYNGGGLQTAGTAVINNSGNIMVNGTSADGLTIDPTSTFRIVASTTAPATDYGQLYITGIPQNFISGKVSKQYRSEYLNGNTTVNTGRQQIGLPFYNYTIPELVSVFGAGNLNVTNITNTSAGRFNVASAFWWNNARARFDQIAYSGTAYDAAGNPNAAFINPMTYYILPRRTASSTTAFWVPNGETKTFVGTPVSDQTTTNVQLTLSGAYSGGFGVNGNGENTFREKYYSYIDDPFRSKSPNWSSDYALNLYQMSNPFLTNLDLKYIAQNEAGTLSDGNNITNLEGVAYYTSGNVSWAIKTGSSYSTALMVTLSAGFFQAGDTRATVIRPLGAFMMKLSSNASQTINFRGTRRFKYSSRASNVDNNVTAAKSSSEKSDEGGEGNLDIPADKIVKQVAVVMYDLEGDELDRTYYAVSPTAVTGSSPLTSLQAYSTDKKIFTREEKPDGGLDFNFADNLYINEANEVDFKSKQIPLYIDYADEPYQLKFEVYEKGERVPDGLSNGNSFYFKNPEGQFIKIVDGSSISMNGSQSGLGLYYEIPEGATLGTGNISNSQTIIAKKDSQWVVRFAKNWKNATVEVYSAAGQLLNSKSQISTGSDYSIPLNYQVKSTFVVKATSEKGEVVIKKIIN